MMNMVMLLRNDEYQIFEHKWQKSEPNELSSN